MVVILFWSKNHFWKHRVHRKLCHFAAKLCQLPKMIQSTKGIQLFQGKDQGLMWRWVHEVKVNEIIDSERFQQKNNISQVSPLNLKQQQKYTWHHVCHIFNIYIYVQLKIVIRRQWKYLFKYYSIIVYENNFI